MPWHASSNKNDKQDDEDDGDLQTCRISKKINYAALDSIVGSGASATAPPSPATASNLFVGEMLEEENSNSIGPLLPNPLLEKSVAGSLRRQETTGLPASISSPALWENLPEEVVEDEHLMELLEEDEEEYEEYEEGDPTEGNDLW